MTDRELLLAVYEGMSELKQGVAGLEQKVDDLTQRTAKLEQKVDDLTQRTAKLEQSVAGLEQKVDDLTQRTAKLEQGMSELNQRTVRVEQSVSEIKVTLENETNHNIQLLAENHCDLVDKLNQAIPVADKALLNEVQISGLRIRVDSLEKEVAEMKDRIA